MLECAQQLYGYRLYDMAQQLFERYLSNLNVIKDEKKKPLAPQITARYGICLCRFNLMLGEDPTVKYPDSLEVALDVLSTIRAQMERVLPDTTLAWLMLNGSVHIYNIADALVDLGHTAKVIQYLNWCILCLESNIMLCAPKFLNWRFKLYATACRCYEVLGQYKEAERCAARGLKMVNLMEKWQTADVHPPVPAQILFTIAQCRSSFNVLVFTYKYINGEIGDDIEAVKAYLNTTFNNDQSHALLALISALKDPLRRVVAYLDAESTQLAVAGDAALKEAAKEKLQAVTEPKSRLLVQTVASILAAAKESSKEATESKEEKKGTEEKEEKESQETSKPPSLLSVKSHTAVLRAAFSQGLWDDFKQIHANFPAPVAAAGEEGADDSDQVHRDEVVLLEALSFWGGKSVDWSRAENVEKVGLLLLDFAGKPLANARENLLTDAALYLWNHHCRPLIQSIKVTMQGVSEYGEDTKVEEQKAKDRWELGLQQSGQGQDGEQLANAGVVMNAGSLPEIPQDVVEEVRDAVINAVRGIVSVLGHFKSDTICTANILLELAAMLEIRNRPGDVEAAVEQLEAGLEMIVATRSDLVTRKAKTELGGLVECLRSDFEGTVTKAYLSDSDAKLQQQTNKPLAVPFPAKAHTLAALHASLVNVLCRLELQAGVVQAHKLSHKLYKKKIAEHQRKIELTGTFKTEMEPHVLPYTYPTKEGQLMERCKHNEYEKALLLMNMARLRPNIENQKRLLEQAASALEKAKKNEDELMASSGLSMDEDSNYTLDTRRSTRSKKWKTVLEPPDFVARDAYSITVRPRVPAAFIKQHKLRSIVLYGKPAEHGITVSVNNVDYKGTGVEIPIPESGIFEPVKVTGLEPNTNYCFAVCGIDGKGKHAPGANSIGKTSADICTLVPLPMELLWGYLAITARQIGITDSLPRLSLSGASGFLFDGIIRNALEKVSQKYLTTTTAQEIQAEVGPWAWLGRLELRQIKGKCLENAPSASLYQLVKLLHIESDIFEQEQHTWKTAPNAPGVVAGSVGTVSKEASVPLKTAAFFHIHLCEVLRPLLVALQVSSVLHDHVLVMQTAERIYNTLVPLLRSIPASVLLPVVATTFILINQVKKALPCTKWPTAIRKISARLCYELVSIGDQHHHPELVEMAVNSHLPHMVKAFEAAKAAYEKARQGYDQRKAESDQEQATFEASKKSKEAELESQLAAIEKELAKKKGAKKGKKGKDEEEEEEEDRPQSALDLEAQLAELRASKNPNAKPPERQPQPSDFFVAIPEDRALANFLLSRPQLHAHGKKLAEKEYGRISQGENYVDIDAALSDMFNPKFYDQAWELLNSQYAKHPRYLELVAKLCSHALAAGENNVQKVHKWLSAVPDLSLNHPSLYTEEQAAEAAAAALAAAEDKAAQDGETAEVAERPKEEPKKEEKKKAGGKGKGKNEPAEEEQPASSEPPRRLESNEILWLSQIDVLRGMVLDSLVRLKGARPSPSNALGWEWELTVEGALEPACATLGEAPVPKLDMTMISEDQTPAADPEVTKSGKGGGKDPKKKDAKAGKKGEPEPQELEAPFDVVAASKERVVRLTRAAQLSCKCRAWGQVQNSIRCLWNIIQSSKLSAADVAKLSFIHPDTASEVETKPAESEGLEEETQDGASQTNKEIANVILSDAMKAAMDAVLEMLTNLKDGDKVLQSSINQIGVFEQEQRGINNDLPPQNSGSMDSMWFVKKADLEMNSLARFVQFVLEMLFHLMAWDDVLRLGLAFNKCTDNAYALEVLRFMLYAQNEIVQRQQGMIADQNQQIRQLDERFRQQSDVIKAKREARRSQRGKREEDAKLEALRADYQAERAPLRATLLELKEALESEASLLAEMRKLNDDTKANNHEYLRSLEQSRNQLVRYYTAQQAEAKAKKEEPRSESALSARPASHMSIRSFGVTSRASSARSRASTMAGGDSDSKIANLSTKSVLSSYKQSLQQLRENGALVFLCRGLLEIGDFMLERNQPKQALVSWSDCVDACFGVIDAIGMRTRTVANATPAQLLDKIGLWNCISGGMAAAKIAKFIHNNDVNSRLECCRFSAALLTAPFACSLAHPMHIHDFGTYDLTSSIWPSMGFDVFNMQTRVRVGHLMESCEFVARCLLRVNDGVRALPLVTLYEHLAYSVCLDVFDVVNARLLKARALIASGMLTAASRILYRVILGADLPKKSPGGPASASFDVELDPKMVYSEHLPPDHVSNRAFCEFLLQNVTPASLEETEEEQQENLGGKSSVQAVYGSNLWMQLNLLKSDFLIEVASLVDESLYQTPLDPEGVLSLAGGEGKTEAAAAGKKGGKGKGGGKDAKKGDAATDSDSWSDFNDKYLQGAQATLVALVSALARPRNLAPAGGDGKGKPPAASEAYVSVLPAELLAESFHRLSLLKQTQGMLAESLAWERKAIESVVSPLVPSKAPVDNMLWLTLRLRRAALLLSQRRRREAIDEGLNASSDATTINDQHCKRTLVQLNCERMLAEGLVPEALEAIEELADYPDTFRADFASGLIDLACLQLKAGRAKKRTVGHQRLEEAEDLLRLWAAEHGFHPRNTAKAPAAKLSGEQREGTDPKVNIGSYSPGRVDTTVVGVTALGDSRTAAQRSLMKSSDEGEGDSTPILNKFLRSLQPNLYYRFVPNWVQVTYNLALSLLHEGQLQAALEKALESEKISKFRVCLSPLVSAELNFLLANIKWRLFQKELQERLTAPPPEEKKYLLVEAVPTVDRSPLDEQKLLDITSRLVSCINAHLTLAHNHAKARSALLALVQVYMQLSGGLIHWTRPEVLVKRKRTVDTPFKEGEHKRVEYAHWAAYYLIVASKLASMEQYLVANIEQLAVAGIENLQELPAFISEDLGHSQGLREALRKEEIALIGNDPSGGAAVAAADKGAKGGKKGGAAADPAESSQARDLLYYFLSLKKEQQSNTLGSMLPMRSPCQTDPPSNTGAMLIRLHHFLSQNSADYKANCCFTSRVLAAEHLARPASSDAAGEGEEAVQSAYDSLVQQIKDVMTEGLVVAQWSDRAWLDGNLDEIANSRLFFTLSTASVSETAQATPFNNGMIVVQSTDALSMCGLFGKLRHTLQSMETEEGEPEEMERARGQNEQEFRHLMRLVKGLFATPATQVDDASAEEGVAHVSVLDQLLADPEALASDTEGDDGQLACTLENVTAMESLFDMTSRGGMAMVNAALWSRLSSYLSKSTVALTNGTAAAPESETDGGSGTASGSS